MNVVTTTDLVYYRLLQPLKLISMLTAVVTGASAVSDAVRGGCGVEWLVM
jgi:hypothetical protein